MTDANDPDAVFPKLEPVRPPDGAPNVLIVLLDDVGFGASSAFGGLVDTPTADRLAGDGLRYTRFHTTALCAPTRAALLSGRNHHTVGMGAITELATSAPGNTSVRPQDCAPLAETLRLNGYSTSQFGKCHEVPVWETSPMGPFDRWPTGSGFEHFYGFVGGETNQYDPALYEGTTPVGPGSTPEEGYHFTVDMTDKSIDWVRQQKALMPDKPFFMYWAPGATHAPHHVPPEWSAKYAGRFDDGWDVLRERIFARQMELAVVGPGAELTGRPDEIPAWDDMDDQLKPVLTRQMEVYAGFLEHTDHQLGRLIDALEDMEILDDTLIFYIIGDNGASAEGTLRGTFNELLVLNGVGDLETTEFMAERIELFGTPDAFNHYAVGWAHAMCTPYQWTKQVASHWGGTRNGTIVHWPRGISAHGELRHQFGHVIDIAPTVLRAAGIPEPVIVNGFDQHPYEGFELNDTFDDALAAEVHETQYFEMFANRAIYHKGWTAVTRHSTPWLMGRSLPDLRDDVWELYAPGDWTQSNDVSSDHPAELRRLQGLFLTEAARHNALPLDDRRSERFDPDRAGRPQLIRGNTQLLYGGMGRLSENSVVSIKNKSHAITSQVIIPADGASGTIIAQGGKFGGWTVYLTTDGRPAYCYNLLGLELFKVVGTDPVPEGERQIRVEFDYDGGGPGKGGTAQLYVDGELVATGRVDATVPGVFSADETTDVGTDAATGVTDDLDRSTVGFTGDVQWVQIDLGDAAEDADHVLSPEERLRIAMSRQ
jgi:arylsulfatase A-like enzyme